MLKKFVEYKYIKLANKRAGAEPSLTIQIYEGLGVFGSIVSIFGAFGCGVLIFVSCWNKKQFCPMNHKSSESEEWAKNGRKLQVNKEQALNNCPHPQRTICAQKLSQLPKRTSKHHFGILSIKIIMKLQGQLVSYSVQKLIWIVWECREWCTRRKQSKVGRVGWQEGFFYPILFFPATRYSHTLPCHAAAACRELGFQVGVFVRRVALPSGWDTKPACRYLRVNSLWQIHTIWTTQSLHNWIPLIDLKQDWLGRQYSFEQNWPESRSQAMMANGSKLMALGGSPLRTKF